MLKKSMRLNLRISPEESDRLKNMVRLSKSDNATDVVRQSLAIYERVLLAREQGVQLKLRTPEGEETDLLMAWELPR